MPAPTSRPVGQNVHNLYLGMIVQSLWRSPVWPRSGAPRAAFLDFLNGTGLGPTGCAAQPGPDHADWTPTFTTELLRKDFDLGLASARSAEVSMPLTALLMQVIQASIGNGHRDDDFLSLFGAPGGLVGDGRGAGAATPHRVLARDRHVVTAVRPDTEVRGVLSSLFKDFYKLERRDDGVLLVQAHTEGGPIRLNVQNHRSLGQLLKVDRRRPGERASDPHRAGRSTS